ncbi:MULTISPECIES: GGDEF domain-containing protein [Pseudomonas]|uniref:diguanylate cyclase n=1 Tax=Pseudomonas asplenii TaxID=53407 RepID=A0A0N0E4G8_9PSED|nr:GGDEF domain-containing protein [Pseudomonas fuscovaginae]KPA91256.1 diguanylate cyclase (GGDEF) domain-containing protein [Pseudomonas fuscovaginae]KPA99425.1 diguanylate cyclase (GGDEF) domain-containing protein [Pseudomonas fuscovaginae]
MPATFKIRPRMRTLLSPAVTKAELAGLVAWLWVLLLDPLSGLNLANVLVTACLLALWYFHRVVTSFPVWRVLGGLYIFFLALGFVQVIEAHVALRIFSLPLAVIMVVGSAILFITIQDYLISTTAVWILIWPSLDVGAYQGLEIYLVLFCIFSMMIGFILNLTYLRNMRSVLLIESEFRTLAETDFLTSLLNRRAFMGSFQKVLAQGNSGYFIMLDIDSFKLKNDQYGHDIGDRILCAMATCLKSTPGSHSVGRLGGEEFGVLLLGDDDAIAHEYALRLLAAIRVSVSPPHHYTCSAGIARFSATSDMSAVLKCADSNMYKAKQDGKDRVFQDGKPLVPPFPPAA